MVLPGLGHDSGFSAAPPGHATRVVEHRLYAVTRTRRWPPRCPWRIFWPVPIRRSTQPTSASARSRPFRWSTGVRTFRPDCSGSLPQTTQPVTPAVVLIRCRGIEQVPDVVTAPTANRSGPAGRSYLFGGPGALIDRLLYGSAGHAHAEA